MRFRRITSVDSGNDRLISNRTPKPRSRFGRDGRDAEADEIAASKTKTKKPRRAARHASGPEAQRGASRRSSRGVHPGPRRLVALFHAHIAKVRARDAPRASRVSPSARPDPASVATGTGAARSPRSRVARPMMARSPADPTHLSSLVSVPSALPSRVDNQPSRRADVVDKQHSVIMLIPKKNRKEVYKYLFRGAYPGPSSQSSRARAMIEKKCRDNTPET